MTTFFSIDVETSAVDTRYGLLLSVGVQPVYWEPGKEATFVHDVFYRRIDRTQQLTERGWFDGSGDHSQDAYAWWLEQNAPARYDAWEDLTLVRFHPEVVATQLAAYAIRLEPKDGDRIFVANPVAFDKKYVDLLFAEANLDNPFHYRSLCLRSMRFGLEKNSGWGASRETHDPVVPHHAFSDAEAQAFDLIDLLKRRDED